MKTSLRDELTLRALMVFGLGFATATASMPALADSPSLDETIVYINSHIRNCEIRVDGHLIQIDCRNRHFSADIFDLGYGEDRQDGNVQFVCAHDKWCWSIADRDEFDKNGSGAIGFGCENSMICPRVANAFNHLIKLVKTQYRPPDDDPFAHKVP